MTQALFDGVEVPYVAQQHQITDYCRLTYTDAELNVNHDNVRKAIAVQGPDLLETRVWRDKE
jgi:hypothetical protein